MVAKVREGWSRRRRRGPVTKVATIAKGQIGRHADVAVTKLTDVVGGPARRRVVLLLAGVLSLNSADTGAVGALAPQLERSFSIGNGEFGLLVTASSLVGVVATIPMGVLADRVPRVRILVVAITIWAAAMVASGLAVSYLTLLLSRLALGIVTAAAGPAVASLTGDLFPAADRGRIYGYVLTGELLGAGGGLLVAGDLGAALGWRVAFFLLAVPSVALAIALRRLLPEPARGGQSRLRRGDDRILAADAADRIGPEDGGRDDQPPASESLVRHQVADRADIAADDGHILTRDPHHLSLWQAAGYVLAVSSNRVFIVVSALGYFFLGGLRTFTVLFARGQFGLGQATVSLVLALIGAGAVAGTLVGGHLTDRLIRKGITDARVLVAGISFIAATVIAVPGFLSRSLIIALPLFIVAGALLAAPNPPLDSARLDVMPSAMWGRAESIRTSARTLLEAFAPLVFGFVSELFGGNGGGFSAGVNSGHTGITARASHGLELTFLVMLIPLALSGLLLLRQRRPYLVDVAAADLSERELQSKGSVPGGTTPAA